MSARRQKRFLLTSTKTTIACNKAIKIVELPCCVKKAWSPVETQQRSSVYEIEANMSKFNEATRVQMPAMVHLTRLGYQYFGKIHEAMEDTIYDGDTNILLEVFKQQLEKLNPGHEGEYLQILRDIRKELNDDDLGRGFYKRLKSVSPVRLIDFEHPEQNLFHFTAEFTCKNGQDEFRPDITLFVNGFHFAL